MPAQHKKTVYKPLPITNPFQESADKAYSEILYDKIKEAKIWRMTTFAHLGLFLLSLIFFLIAISQQKTIPVLVNVMPSGESTYLGEVRQRGAVQVPEAAIIYQIRTFVINLRTISTDYQVVYDNIDDNFQMVTSKYLPIMRQMINNDNPFKQVGQVRRTVEIESILLVTGRSYQVNWNETTYDTSSSQKTYKMRAVITIVLATPTDTTIKRNPLGIYIENYEATEL